jgi:hypothetical protein
VPIALAHAHAHQSSRRRFARDCSLSRRGNITSHRLVHIFFRISLRLLRVGATTTPSPSSSSTSLTEWTSLIQGVPTLGGGPSSSLSARDARRLRRRVGVFVSGSICLLAAVVAVRPGRGRRGVCSLGRACPETWMIGGSASPPVGLGLRGVPPRRVHETNTKFGLVQISSGGCALQKRKEELSRVMTNNQLLDEIENHR